MKLKEIITVIIIALILLILMVLYEKTKPANHKGGIIDFILGSNDNKSNTQQKTGSQYDNIILTKNLEFNNAKITGFGAKVNDVKRNIYDDGIRSLKFGEFNVIKIIDNSKEDTLDSHPKTINGFQVRIGTIAKIKLTKDITSMIPNQLIMYTY